MVLLIVTALQVVDSLKRGHQVMVFVHSRKDTGKTGRILADLAAKAGESALFEAEGDDPRRGLAVREVNKWVQYGHKLCRMNPDLNSQQQQPITRHVWQALVQKVFVNSVFGSVSHTLCTV